MTDRFTDTIDMQNSVSEFLDVYSSRPIKENAGGMGVNHSWALWYVLRRVNPSVVVESGVWKGHSTWLIHTALPNAEIYSFDVSFSRLEYKCPASTYTERDWSLFDWSNVDLSNSLALFDDHQNCYNRLIQAYWYGIRHAIIEDNYPTGQGDCYSLKQVMARSGAPKIQMSENSRKRLGRELYYSIQERLYQYIGHHQHRVIAPNDYDSGNLQQRLEHYQIMPPLIVGKESMYGHPWTGEYARPEEIAPGDPKLQQLDRAYNFMTYVKMK